MKRGRYRTRKAMKRDVHRGGQRYMQPKSVKRPVLSAVGEAIRKIAARGV